MFTTHARKLSLLICLLLLCSCNSLIYKEKWESMGEAEYNVDFSILWEGIKLTLIEHFDTVELERSSEGILRTGWKEDLNYLVGQGLREQAHIKVAKGEKGWAVKVRVAREINEEPIYTLDPKRARWAATNDNTGGAQHLVGLIHIKMKVILDDK